VYRAECFISWIPAETTPRRKEKTETTERLALLQVGSYLNFCEMVAVITITSGPLPASLPTGLTRPVRRNLVPDMVEEARLPLLLVEHDDKLALLRVPQ
jgi:hypothetical protein